MINEQELKDQTETIRTEEKSIVDFEVIKEALQRLRQLAKTLPPNHLSLTVCGRACG